MREKVAIQLILFYTDFITREKDTHMLESYITVKQDGFSEIEIKKSRFICSVKRVTSEEEAKAFIAAIKKEHWKANHNCSAFVIGEKMTFSGAAMTANLVALLVFQCWKS